MNIKDITYVGNAYDLSFSSNVFGYSRESRIIKCEGLSLNNQLIVIESIQFKSTKTGTWEKQGKNFCYLQSDSSKIFDSELDLIKHYCEWELEYDS